MCAGRSHCWVSAEKKITIFIRNESQQGWDEPTHKRCSMG